MGRLFALVLTICLWFSFAPAASADSYQNLTPCGENPAFVQKAKNANTPGAKARFEKYSTLLCGPEGYPHLIVDGNLAHINEFGIPSLLFLYIAGWIGWAGRSYVIAARDSGKAEEKEIIIDIPLAIKCSLGSAAWPLAAFGEFTSGKLTAKNNEITVSPR
ncbi:Photosystem I reaction center subunit III [Phormidium pseudopriestleyi FRX01]|uniref:Photosystem I reaction center subunit III n=1 Tax=Phormidium pseudopriestleyi FRX01 TaxID=1759528 RepID=A0ABS3FPK2_9CYAN|nr:Photosystem I reaction center subunit III [Phormidium pseudopriestleyi]MBO0349054.1 Photosystem I reaction center subunit III [Phormidium pseudopriestleyi FRX01]